VVLTQGQTVNPGETATNQSNIKIWTRLNKLCRINTRKQECSWFIKSRSINAYLKVNFQAEAVERGKITQVLPRFFDQGITASFNYLVHQELI
jgi:hypothetical protein